MGLIQHHVPTMRVAFTLRIKHVGSQRWTYQLTGGDNERGAQKLEN